MPDVGGLGQSGKLMHRRGVSAGSGHAATPEPNGDLTDARRHLLEAERSAQVWEGTAWQASILEVKAHLAAAEGDQPGALRLRRDAADMFEDSGQPLDAARCRA